MGTRSLIMIDSNLVAELDKSFPHFLRSVLLSSVYLVVGYFLNLFLKQAIKRISKKVLESDHKDQRELKARIDTITAILGKSSTIMIVILIIMMVLSEMGIAIGPLLAGLGIFGVAFGFGAQYLIKDLISGFFIIFEDRMRVGDFLKIDSYEGTVENISLRTTVLRNLGGQIFIIPNGEIKVIENFSRGFIRCIVDIDLPYSLSVENARNFLKEAKEALMQNQTFKENLLDDVEIKGILDFSPSSFKFRILAKMTPDMGRVEAETIIRNTVFSTLKKNGVEVPHPQMDIHLKKE
jgi:small conductance mechanosensitive channel